MRYLIVHKILSPFEAIYLLLNNLKLFFTNLWYINTKFTASELTKI